MVKVFIIGGAGNIARRLAQILSDKDHEVLALHRKPEQAQELSALGATPVTGDLTKLSVASLSTLMRGADIAVFSAGAGGKGGPEMTKAIDGRGLELAVAAAKEAGVKRFLLVSVFPDALRGKTMPDSFENYMSVKKQADVYLAESDLEWVIVRPGTLTDNAGTGKVRAGLAIPYGDVTRDDVAAVLAELVDSPHINRAIIELTEGDTPVSDAIRGIG